MNPMKNMPLSVGILTLFMGFVAVVRYHYSLTTQDLMGNEFGAIFFLSFGAISTILGLYLHFFRRNLLEEPERVKNMEMGIDDSD